EGRRAAELDMRLHQPRAVLADLLLPTEELGVDEIDRADVERRGRPHFSAERDEPLDEIEARPAEIETAVDMGGLDVDEAARIDRFCKAGDEPHGERRRRPAPAGQELAIEGGELDHEPEASGATRGSSTQHPSPALPQLCCGPKGWGLPQPTAEALHDRRRKLPRRITAFHTPSGAPPFRLRGEG